MKCYGMEERIVAANGCLPFPTRSLQSLAAHTKLANKLENSTLDCKQTAYYIKYIKHLTNIVFFLAESFSFISS